LNLRERDRMIGEVDKSSCLETSKDRAGGLEALGRIAIEEEGEVYDRDEEVGVIDCAFLGAHFGGAGFCKRGLAKIDVVEVKCVFFEKKINSFI